MSSGKQMNSLLSSSYFLKAVAVSDTINGVGLLIGGLAVPYLAVQLLGDGSLSAGLTTLVSENPERLTPLATLDRRGGVTSVPWPTLLTGMMFIQVFYWSTNQVVVQRALGARSLAEGQKGVLFASLMKLVGPLMLCLPGLVALHMLDQLTLTLDLGQLRDALASAGSAVPAEALALGQSLVGGEAASATTITLAQAEQLHGLMAFNDQVYPAVVRSVIQNPWALGLFAAVLVGSILSSFNSALNSAATLFCLEFYEERLTQSFESEEARAAHIVKIGQRFALTLALIAMFIAPLLVELESIFDYLQKVNGLYSVPIISIFLVGLLGTKAPAGGAKLSILLGMLCYGFFSFFVDGETLHWLHGYAISFVVAVGTLLIAGKLSPRSDEAIAAASAAQSAPVDMSPWRHAKLAAGVIVALTIACYLGLVSLAGGF